MANTQNNTNKSRHYLVMKTELDVMMKSAKKRRFYLGCRSFGVTSFFLGLFLTLITKPKGSINYMAIWTAFAGLVLIIGIAGGWRVKRAVKRTINDVESRGTEETKCQ